MRDPLLVKFQELKDCPNPQKRGRDLEELVAQLFRESHFNVRTNATTALPRQTDLMARNGEGAYLVEIKWTKEPSDVSDVDSLHSRLRRVPISVIGVLISIEGFTKPALREIEGQRADRLVIPLDGGEFSVLLEEPMELPRVLRRKQDDLLTYGSLKPASPQLPLRRLPARSALSKAPITVLGTDGSRDLLVASEGDFVGFTFSRELHDIDWVSAGGHGVSWDLPIRAFDQSGLIEVLAELSEIKWAGPKGHWSISQSTRNWHGFGGESLALALEGWEERYGELAEFHHTEQLCYTDTCPDGFYTLTADIAASEPRRVWHSRLSFQLSGVPLHQEPYRRLAEAVAAGVTTYFRPRSSPSVSRSRLGAARIPLETIARLVEFDEHDDPVEWVVGVVAKNPFFHNPDLLSKLDFNLDALGVRLEEAELLICDLASWHPLDKPHGYVLLGLDAARTSEAAVLSLRVDWDEPFSTEVISPQTLD